MGLLDASFALAHRVLLFRGARSRFARAPTGRVHFYDLRGRGEHGTLVLQHGIGAESLHFVPVLPLLRRHYGRVLLLDLPGHGRSDPAPTMTPETVFEGFAHALDEALTEADAPDRRAVVFGNSLGGAMAAQYALERPERTRALILASPAGAAVAAERMAELLGSFDFADTAAVLAFMAKLNPRVPLGASLFAGDVRARFSRPHIRALLASVRPEHGLPPEKLAGLTMPTLLLWGRLDRLMPPEMLAWYRAHLPPGALIEEPACGHCPQVDRPVWTARRILRFSRTLRGDG